MSDVRSYAMGGVIGLVIGIGLGCLGVSVGMLVGRMF